MRRTVGAFFAVGLCVVGVWAFQAQLKTADRHDTGLGPNVYATRPAERATLTLRDGSRVVLGPATVLRVQSSSSGGRAIAVEVVGEALFAVPHAADHPFVVTAHGVTTRVLGTEFVVRAYDASSVRVAVRSGRVSVQSPALTATSAVVVDALMAASIRHGIPTISQIDDPSTEFAWAQGELVLRDVPLGDAIDRLNRWYGMTFRATDQALLRLPIDGRFPPQFDMRHLDAIATAINATVTRSGSVITFHPAP